MHERLLLIVSGAMLGAVAAALSNPFWITAAVRCWSGVSGS